MWSMKKAIQCRTCWKMVLISTEFPPGKCKMCGWWEGSELLVVTDERRWSCHRPHPRNTPILVTTWLLQVIIQRKRKARIWCLICILLNWMKGASCVGNGPSSGGAGAVHMHTWTGFACSLQDLPIKKCRMLFLYTVVQQCWFDSSGFS